MAQRTKEITNIQDQIYSRDVIERIDFLESELDDAYEGEGKSERITKAKEDWIKAAADDGTHTLQDAAREYIALVALQDEAEGYSDDWKHGEMLIRHTYFVKAMQELCEDAGDVPKDIPSYIEIDWKATAENMKADYTEVDFDGVAYFIR